MLSMRNIDGERHQNRDSLGNYSASGPKIRLSVGLALNRNQSGSVGHAWLKPGAWGKQRRRLQLPKAPRPARIRYAKALRAGFRPT
jgi:hypothetical protein